MNMSEHVFKVSTTKANISLMATLLVFRSVGDGPSQTKFASSLFTGLQRHESLFHTRIAV